MAGSIYEFAPGSASIRGTGNDHGRQQAGAPGMDYLTCVNQALPTIRAGME
jgi:hypothetical protein